MATVRNIVVLAVAGLLIWFAVDYVTAPDTLAPALATPARAPAASGVAPAPGRVPACAPHKADEAASLPALIQRLTASRDPGDAYQVYRYIADCEMMAPAFAIEPLPPWQAAQKKRCASITDVMRRSRYDYLTTAAYAGVPGAGSDWLRYGPGGELSALQSRPNDPLVTAWIEQARAMVIRDGDAGDINALQDLMHGYAGKTPIFEADPARRLAYAMAYKDVIGMLQLGVVPPNLPDDVELAALAAPLSPQQVEWARSKAAAIVAARRVRGNGR